MMLYYKVADAQDMQQRNSIVHLDLNQITLMISSCINDNPRS